MTDESSRVVTIEIQGQRYSIRSQLDPAYVTELAAYVDGKLQAAGDATPLGDSIKIAVLAALNIADEYFRCRQEDRSRVGEIAQRAEELERLLDDVLGKITT